MNILVTGASGFLGSRLACRFLAAGHRVAALGRPRSNFAGLISGLEIFRVGDDAAIRSAVTAFRPDVVLHAAACYGRAGESPLDLLDGNLRFGAALLDALGRTDAGPVHFINTGTVLDCDVSVYAWWKNAFSEWGIRLANASESPVQFTDVRLQHMYGPGDDRSKFVTHIVASCLESVPELPLTSGKQRRDFIFVEDVIDAIEVLVANAAQLKKSEAIEVGSGEATAVRALVEKIHALTHSSTRLSFDRVSVRAGEAPLYVADTARMTQLGWVSRTCLDDGLARTIAFCRASLPNSR